MGKYDEMLAGLKARREEIEAEIRAQEALLVERAGIDEAIKALEALASGKPAAASGAGTAEAAKEILEQAMGPLSGQEIWDRLKKRGHNVKLSSLGSILARHDGIERVSRGVWRAK